MAKKCPPGKYYCFTDKKCKKIPRGYRIGSRGYLARDNRSDSDENDSNNIKHIMSLIATKSFA